MPTGIYIRTKETKKILSDAQKRRGTIPPSQRGKTPWNKGKTGIYSEETLSKISENTTKAMIGHSVSEKTRKKIGIAHSGDKCPWWKGGVSTFNKSLRQNLMDTFEYRQWRRMVFARDHYRCKVCNLKENCLHAHHIKKWAEYPKLRLDVNNGITVCKECDIKLINHNEESWERYFKLLII